MVRRFSRYLPVGPLTVTPRLVVLVVDRSVGILLPLTSIDASLVVPCQSLWRLTPVVCIAGSTGLCFSCSIHSVLSLLL
jgi:hypothetical protein